MASPGPTKFRFGLFELDAATGELRKSGVLLKLQPQPLRVLELLVQRSGQLVTREEIQQHLWKESTFVDFEHGINFSINQIRATLADNPEKPRYVETLSRRGYRFISPVESVVDGPSMRVVQEQRSTQPAKIADAKNQKDLRLRYQSAAEIRTDLQRLKRDSDSGRAPTVATQVELASTAQSRQFRWAAATGVAILFVGTAVGAWLLHSRRVRPLTDKDRIVLADFTNTTGDTVFDGTLRQGLSTLLEQSPFLNIVSDERIHQTLQMMGQEGNAKLTSQTSREVCQRTSSMALLEGTISQIGSQYLLTLRATNCVNGESLASAEAQASDKNHVLDALGKAASEIRSKLGESLSSMKKFDTPLEQATTPSLEALQAYSLAAEKDREFAPSITLFKRAIQLDPNFALAYAGLGYAYANSLQPGLAAPNFKMAYDLRDHVTEREKLLIESAYFWNVDGDLQRTVQVLEVLKDTYPREFWAPNDLSVIYGQLGEHEKALAEAQEAARRDPANDSNYVELTAAYLNLNRFDEAKTTAEEGLTKDNNNLPLRFALYRLAFLRNDATEMAKQVAWSAGKPWAEDTFLSLEAGTAAYFGRVAAARNLSLRAVTSAETMEKKELAAAYESTAAVREALLGNAVQARQEAIAALTVSKGRDIQFQAALALAFAGDVPRAQALADDLARRFPADTIVQFSFLPRIRAQIALHQNQAQKAVEALQPVLSRYELGTGVGLPIYMRGEAYLAAHQHSEAAVEFQKILDHRGIVAHDAIGALAHLQLGRAYAMQGDTAKARVAYQDFLTLWKNADPDVSILKEAKAEYAKLQ